MIAYDLHMHSCLSPCADEEMTPNNIVNMALVSGLQAISVTDHNTMKHQHVLSKCARDKGLEYVCGVELCSREEVHVLGYFKEEYVDEFQAWIETHSSKRQNKIEFFGHQTLRNSEDEFLCEESQLLLDALDVPLEECVKAIHQHNGKAVLAHVYGKNNGVIEQLGFIPMGLPLEALEVRNLKEIALVKENSPWIECDCWLCSSDAHQLIDIHEAEYTLTQEEWERLKG